MKRREFLEQALLSSVALASGVLRSNGATAVSMPHMKAAIFGHTGRGNYGHGLDVVFNARPNIEVVAIADPDGKGRAAAQTRAKAARSYADYRELLKAERPQLVVVAPRWSDQHHAMMNAALEAGAHV